MYSVEFEESDYGGEFAEELVIKYNNKEIARHRDKCEPEDALFCRHWDWVQEQLEQAYKIGKADGYMECVQDQENQSQYKTAR